MFIYSGFIAITYNTITIALCPGSLSRYDSQKGKSVNWTAMFIKSDLALILSTEQATPDLTLQCSAADHELNVFLVEQNRTNWSLCG